MILLEIFFACVKRWWHIICHSFLLDFKHRECSLTTNMDGFFNLKIYCECGKVFGEWKIKKDTKNDGK